MPFDDGGILLLEGGDGFFTDDKLPVLNLDCATRLAMIASFWNISPTLVNMLFNKQSPVGEGIPTDK